MLPTIVENQPQANYSAFASDFKNKLNYIMRTILDITELLVPIEDTIRNHF